MGPRYFRCWYARGSCRGKAGRGKLEARVRAVRVAASARFKGLPPSIWRGPAVALLGRWLGINVGLLNVGGVRPGCGSLARAARAVRVSCGQSSESSWDGVVRGPGACSRVRMEAGRGPGSRGTERSPVSMPGAARGAARAHCRQRPDGPRAGRRAPPCPCSAGSSLGWSP